MWLWSHTSVSWYCLFASTYSSRHSYDWSSQQHGQLVSLIFGLWLILLFIQAFGIGLCHRVNNGQYEVCYHQHHQLLKDPLQNAMGLGRYICGGGKGWVASEHHWARITTLVARWHTMTYHLLRVPLWCEVFLSLFIYELFKGSFNNRTNVRNAPAQHTHTWLQGFHHF